MWIYRRVLGFNYLAAAGEDGGAGGSAPDPNPNPDPTKDPANLLSALNKERDRASQNEKALLDAKTRQEELQAQLDRVQSIDPEKYQQMLENQRKLEEEALVQSNQWSTLKTQAQEEVAIAKQQVATLESNYNQLLIKDQLGKAFRAAGGIEDIKPIDGVEQVNPIDLLSTFLAPRIKFDNGKVTLLDAMGREEKNAEGKPKTLSEKMFELKRGSFPNLFRAESTASGSGAPANMTRFDGKALTVYTRAQARAGRADMAAVARGEAIIMDS
jgi:hypothetical protein